MTLGERIADAAMTLLDVPFRLRGRSASTGVDCVGLALLALRGGGLKVPEPPSYALRGMTRESADIVLRQAGLAPAAGDGTGDLLLVESGPMQLHLMIRGQRGHIHAHAGLRRVVLMPGLSPWPILGRWRALPPSSEV